MRIRWSQLAILVMAISSAACGLTVNYRVDGKIVFRPWAPCGAANDHCMRAVHLLEVPDTDFDAALAELAKAAAKAASDPIALASVYWNVAVTHHAMGEPLNVHVALGKSRDAAPEGSYERSRAEKEIARVEAAHPEVKRAGGPGSAKPGAAARPREAKLPKMPKEVKVCERPTKVITLDDFRDGDGYGCDKGDAIVLENVTIALKPDQSDTINLNCCAHLDNVTVTGGGIYVGSTGSVKLTNVKVTADTKYEETGLRVSERASAVLEGGRYESAAEPIRVAGSARLTKVTVVGAGSSAAISIREGNAFLDGCEAKGNGMGGALRVFEKARVAVRGGTYTNHDTGVASSAVRIEGHLTADDVAVTGPIGAREGRCLLRNVTAVGDLIAFDDANVTIEGGSYTSEGDAFQFRGESVGLIREAKVSGKPVAIRVWEGAYVKVIGGEQSGSMDADTPGTLELSK